MKRVFVTLVLAAYLITACLADERDVALSHQQNGDTEAAIAAYNQWINSHPQHPDAALTLIYAASIHESPLEALGFLSAHVESLPTITASEVYARMAGLESLLGLPADAAKHYERAALAEGSEKNRRLLEAASLRLSMGETETARIMTIQLLNEGLDDSLRDEAASLAAMALATGGRPEEALKEIEAYIQRGLPHSPLPYLALREISMALGNRSGLEEAHSSLSRYFNESAALYLAQKRILAWVSPSSLIRERFITPGSPIQVGAFRNREGASNLRERLEEDGYISWIEDTDGLWKVLVNDSDGNTVSRLATDGYLESVSGR